MRDLYSLIRPALFCFPAEAARELALWAIRAGLDRFLIDRSAQNSDPAILAQPLWRSTFPNPIGLAAGFDKDARVAHRVERWGFGFVEIGTVTPRPQRGNRKPRVFRLREDEAIVNYMGFNSGGLDAVVGRLSRRARCGIVGVNLGKNRDSTDAARDYEEGICRTAALADYLVVNISSPNTPGLRDLQRRVPLESLLRRLIRLRDATDSQVPLLLKIAPDLRPRDRRDIAEVVLDTGIDGLVVANTTIERPADLRSRNAQKPGGLSGRPLFGPSTELLSDMYRLTRGRLPLVGVGGIANAEDAYAKIRAGASLVQIHTSLTFEGPALVGRIKTGLAALLQRDGFKSITEAVGTATGAGPAVPPIGTMERVA